MRHLLALTFFSLLYYVVRLPTSPLVLPYYDDSETLYHVLSILEGRIPYRDDFTHHFLGYTLPFIATAKVVGFSPALIKYVAFMNQVLMGFGVYLCLRLFFSFPLAVIGGALAISAREPWVLGFFQQYQMNLLMVYIWYFSLLYVMQGKTYTLYIAAFLAGTLFTFDQRALFGSLVPFFAFVLGWRQNKQHAWRIAPSFVAAGILPVAAALIYLVYNSAFTPFIEQTFIFPKRYRVGSRSFFETLIDGIYLHKYLLELSPIMAATALIGLLALLRSLKETPSSSQKNALYLVALFIVPLIIMPFFGSRDFDYYTITWLPYLALLTVFSTNFFQHFRNRIGALYRCVLVLPIVMSLSSTYTLIKLDEVRDYSGDGIEEVLSFLRPRIKESDALLVWGYRHDVYVRLKHLSFSPFSSLMTIHPDFKITGTENRLKHIYPKYQTLFFDILDKKLPDYIVTFHRVVHSDSPADTRVKEEIAKHYELAFEITKPDFQRVDCSWKVYQRQL